MKSLVGIFVVLIVGVIFIAVWDSNLSSPIEDASYNQVAWRSPGGDESIKVKNSFLKTGTALCTVYFIKKISDDEYIIACDEGQDSWTYYTVNTKNNKVQNTSSAVIAGLIPPEGSERNNFQEKIVVKEASETPIPTKPVRVNPTIEAK